MPTHLACASLPAERRTITSVPPARGRYPSATRSQASSRVRAVTSSKLSGTLRPAAPLELDRFHHALEDTGVSGAAADVAGECLANVGFLRLRYAIEELTGGEDHPGSADATLRTAVIDECLLDGGELGTLRQPLDRGHLAPADLRDRHQARVDQLAVDQHGA